MSFKRAISIFAAVATCSWCCANCSAMKENLKLDYLSSKCDDGNCDDEKDKKNLSDKFDEKSDEEAKKLGDDKEKKGEE